MVDWDMPNKAAADWARHHSYNLDYAGVEATPEINATMQREIPWFIEESVTLGELIKRLTEPNGPFTREQAESIAATETTRAFSEGNQKKWRDEGIIEGKKWNTANDPHVCETCRALHGYVLPVNALFLGLFKGPPAHKGCRCWVTPVPLFDDQRIENGKVVTVNKGARTSSKTPTNRKGESKPKHQEAAEEKRRPWWKFWR